MIIKQFQETPSTRTGQPSIDATKNRMENPLPAVGWREWLELPDLGVNWIKAKVDTGARSSALHVANLKIVADPVGGQTAVFDILPRQRSDQGRVSAQVPLLGRRVVRSSSGTVEERPVVVTTAVVGATTVSFELTLTSRDDLGFRMLLGRQAIRHLFIVNPARSYLGAKPPRKIIAQNWRKDKPEPTGPS